MLVKYVLGVLLFGAGLISGMLAQHVLTPTPDEVPTVSAPDTEIVHATLKQPDAPREESAAWQETISWSEPDSDSPSDAPQSGFTFADHSDQEDRRPPRGREAWTNREAWADRPWTNREAWIAQRRAEHLARQTTVRSNFVKEAGLSDDQTVRFDVLMSAMNLRLQQQAQVLRTALENGTMSRPEARARAMKELGTALAITYDELDRNMPADWRANTTGDAINVWTFVDPDVMRELRPAMGGRGPRPPRNPTANSSPQR